MVFIVPGRLLKTSAFLIEVRLQLAGEEKSAVVENGMITRMYL
jgi:hypothetical protein